MNAVKAALYSKLASDATLTGLLGGTYIYDTVAPDTATRPYIIFQQRSGGPDRETPRDARTFVFTVKCVADGFSTLFAGSIDAQVESALDNATLTVAGYDAFLCVREQPDIDYAETVGGKLVRHVGGTYRVRIAT